MKKYVYLDSVDWGKKIILLVYAYTQSIGGLVVEYSPATRVTRVRFPVHAICFI
jgi:hypothetical protein